MLDINKIYNIDCIQGMKQIDNCSVDMIFCDLPYGTTACKWDTIIPFEQLWEQYNRIIKDNGAIVLFATNPFSSTLITSNIKMFRYEWIWDKTRGSNFQQANYCPMKSHEQILVFSKSNCVYSSGKETMKYNPQKTDGENYISNIGSANLLHNNNMKKLNKVNSDRFPLTIQTFKKDGKLHPTQKPLELCKYIIRTYTNENDIILDNCCGSGSIPLSAKLENRNYIGMDNGICEKKNSTYDG